MRDIRPVKRTPPPEDEDIELFEASTSAKAQRKLPLKESKPAEKKPEAVKETPKKPVPDVKPTEERSRRVLKRARLAGSTVPVAKIHVPDTPPHVHSDANHEGHEETDAPRREMKPAAAAKAVRIGRNERTILLSFFTLVVIASAVAGVIFLPTADVTLHLRTAPLLVDEEVIVAAEDSGDANSIKGTAFFREVATSGSVPVEHTETIGTKATGTARIVNASSEEQRIREQSRLVSADGQLFFMQTHAIVPSNSAATVAIEAAEAGPAGNVEPGRLNFAALDASSQQLVYAEVTQTLAGGTGDEIAVVSDADVERAKQNAGERARTQVEGEIREELPDKWIILEESWTGQLDSFEANTAVGEPTPELGYSAQVTVRVMGFEQEALLQRLEQLLNERLEDEFMLFPGPISYTKSVKDVTWDESKARLLVRVTHTTIPQFDLDTLREKLAGRSVAEAQTYLEGLPGVRSAEINLWPFWALSVPRVEGRIALKLEPERQP